MEDKRKILVVDDESGMREMLSYELGSRGYQVATAGNGEEAMEKMVSENFQLVITDIKMPKMDGLKLLDAVKKAKPEVEVIMSTGYGTVEAAVDAMKKGAYDFVQKPFNIEEIAALAEKALEKTELKMMLGIYEASKAVFSSVKLENLLPVITGITRRILKADDVAVTLTAPSGRQVLSASDGLGGLAAGPLRVEIAEEAASTGSGPVIITGGGTGRLSELAAGGGVRSVLLFPLTLDANTLGVLVASRAAGSEPFSAADLRHATILCAQIAQTIHNSKLYAELGAKIEELERLQSHLVQVEKMAAIGRLAAGVAHEINNPLAGIMGFSELLLKAGDLKPAQAEDVQSILTQTHRCRKIVQNLLYFSRRHASVRKPVDVKELLEISLQLSKHDLASREIQVETDLPAKVPEMYGDPAQLEQVFLNVIANARYALDGRPDPRLRISMKVKDESLELRFADNGCGIAPENISKVFDPFFTTKPIGQGTGLGLSISYGIIRRHNGTITLESRPGSGAEFIITLPTGQVNRANEENPEE